MSAQILREKDANVQPDVQTVAQNEKPTMEKQPIKAEESEQQQSYVSPSDAIMSPASKKLSDFKQRRIGGGKAGGPKRSLFAKAVTSRQKDLGPA